MKNTLIKAISQLNKYQIRAIIDIIYNGIYADSTDIEVFEGCNFIQIMEQLYECVKNGV